MDPLSMGALLGEPGGGDSFTENAEGYEKVFVNGHRTPQGLQWETWRRVNDQGL